MPRPRSIDAHIHEFLAQVSAAHADEFIVMVDGAISRVAKDPVVPQNMQLLKLPPWAPELNPREHVWDELREKAFPNRLVPDLATVGAQLDHYLPQLAVDCGTLRGITACPCIGRAQLESSLELPPAQGLRRRAPEMGRRLRVHRVFAEARARSTRRGPSA